MGFRNQAFHFSIFIFLGVFFTQTTLVQALTTGITFHSAYEYTGSYPDWRVGESVVFLGDVNGDSIGDFAVGAPGPTTPIQ